MKKFMISLFFLHLMLLSVAAGAVVEHEENICLDRTPDEIHAWLVNYNNYRNLDDGVRYEVPIGPFTMNLQLANMIQSDVARFNNDAHGSTGDVLVILRPYNVSDPLLRPRFFIHCTSLWSDATAHTGFEHSCSIIAGNRPTDGSAPSRTQNFSLDGFESRVTVTTSGAQYDAARCREGQSLLHYWFQLVPNGPEVARIKSTALMGLDSMPGVSTFIDTIFGANGDPFFDWYYQQFYRVWSSSIPRTEAHAH